MKQQSQIESLPNDWKSALISDHFKVYDGTHSTPKYVDFGVPFYSVEHVSADNFDKTKYISEEVYERENKRVKLEKGDILMTRIGDIGTAKYIDWDVRASFYVTLALFKNTDQEINNQFFTQFIGSNFFTRELWKKTLHVAFPIKINLGDIGKCRIAIPPLPEQRAIAKVLGAMDQAINANNQLIAQKELRKKWLMQNLLTGKKRLKGFSGEWQEYHLGEMFAERNERNTDDLPLLSIGQNGVYPQEDSIKKDTSNSDKSKYKKICVGDIGYNTMRMWQGRSALSTLEGIVSPAYTILKPRKNADALFFSYLFKTPKMVNLFWRNSQG